MTIQDKEEAKGILFDADDTLIETIPHFNDFHNHKYGTKFVVEDYYTYQMDKLWGMSFNQFLIDEREFYMSEFYKRITAKPGARQLVDQLRLEIPKMVVGTSRGFDTERHLLGTLSELYHPESFDSIHHLGGGFVSSKRIPKWQKCKQEGLDLLIDDFDGHIFAAAEQGIHGILVTAPWNKDIAYLPKNVTRAREMDECFDIIDKKKDLIWRSKR